MADSLQKPSRKWYKKKRYIIPIVLFGLIGLSNSFNNSTPDTTTNLAPTTNQMESVAPLRVPSQIQTQQPVLTIPSIKRNTIPKPIEEVPLSNDNTYINSRGNEVHSPAYAPSVPPGATAICGDGTYSFSQSRRGTCSHHGGVAEWL